MLHCEFKSERKLQVKQQQTCEATALVSQITTTINMSDIYHPNDTTKFPGSYPEYCVTEEQKGEWDCWWNQGAIELECESTKFKARRHAIKSASLRETMKL